MKRKIINYQRDGDGEFKTMFCNCFLKLFFMLKKIKENRKKYLNHFFIL